MNLQQVKIKHSKEEFKRYFPDWKEGKNVNCPLHDDRTPSMSIYKGKSGECLFKCHGCNTGGDIIAFLEKRENISNKEAIELFKGRYNGNSSQRKREKTYDYQDENGKLLYQVVRYEPKSFRQRRPDGNGGWIWNMEGVKRVLYRLPEVIKADTVIIVEGEDDADALFERGLTATTNVGVNPTKVKNVS